MEAEKNSDYKNNIVEEIIDNATALPMEEQSQLLMLAKGMAYIMYPIRWTRQVKGIA